MNRKEILNKINERVSDLELKVLIQEYARLSNVEIYNIKKLLRDDKTKQELSRSDDFLEFNKINNNHYFKGSEMILAILDSDLEYDKELFKSSIGNNDIKKYINEYYNCLDIFYNTHINRLERDEKLKKLGI